MTTAKTPEEIADVLVGVVNATGRKLIACQIFAYGEQCRQEAIAEQSEARPPRQTAKLDQVASAVRAAAYGGADDWAGVARAAIQALKYGPDIVLMLYVGGELITASSFNGVLDGILAERPRG